MGTKTLRPNATEALNGWSVVGAASAHAALADESDASYVDGSTATNWAVDLRFDYLNDLPAGSQIRSVGYRIRANRTSGTVYTLYVRVVGATTITSTWQPDTTIQTFTYAAWASAPASLPNFPNPGPWVEALIQELEDVGGLRTGWETSGSFPNNLRIYAVYLDVLYNELPVAVIDAPTPAQVFTTSTPTLTVHHTDPENDQLERVRMKVFSQAQYTAVGFDPETSAATWDSGDLLVSGNPGTQYSTTPSALANDTYRLYTKVGDTTPVGYAAKWSTWQNVTFTINVQPPGVPALSAVTWDTVNERMTMLVTTGVAATGATTQTVEVQRSVDGGVTWQAVQGAAAVGPLTSTGDRANVYDYFVPRKAAAVVYRARASSVVGTETRTSAWSAASASVATTVVECTRLKSPSASTANLIVDEVDTRKRSTSGADVAVFEAKGRADPIVHLGAIRAEMFTLTLFFETDAEFDAFEALRARKEAVLLQLPYGDTTAAAAEQMWVKFGGREQTRYTTAIMATKQYRTATLPVWEVAEPPASAFGAMWALPAIIASDSFTAANGTALNGKLLDTGQVWTASGTLVVNANAASLNAAVNDHVAFLNVGTARQIVNATITKRSTSTRQVGVLFRHVDGNNYWRLVVDAASTFLRKRVAGVTTTLNTWAGSADGDELTAIADGNNIHAYRNGVLLQSFVDADLNAATNAGITMSDDATLLARIDDWSVR